jgi:SAM-dependent methyltransferase
MGEVVVSQMDIDHLAAIRSNVVRFMEHCRTYVSGPGRMLDIAPQVHEGAAPFFSGVTIETLDIDPKSGASYIADLCRTNRDSIPDHHFRWVVCTEVLEHTLDPFAAVKEIARVLEPGGYLFASAPYNFRIHGPLPDCWRFTEHGWRALLHSAAFEIVELRGLPTSGRDLMPIHYTVIARSAA